MKSFWLLSAVFCIGASIATMASAYNPNSPRWLMLMADSAFFIIAGAVCLLLAGGAI